MLRNLRVSDIEAVVEIDRLSFPPGDQYAAAFYHGIVASRTYEAVAATGNEGNVVAWALIDLQREPVRVRTIAVHPAFRGRGFATALLRRVFERHTAVDLLVDETNIAALQLYRHLGFVVSTPDVEMPGRLRMTWQRL